MHNDSGGEAMIYEVNGENQPANNCTINAAFAIQGGDNEDWEDITADSQFIYIADVGNNRGDREDLVIYKVNKSALLHIEKPTVEEIHIRYSTQTDFTPANHATAYDAEALVSIGDSLYLFSKNWLNFSTTIYRIPKTPGTFNLGPMATYQVNALITGADYHEATQNLALCGYNFAGVVLLRAHIEQGRDLRNALFLTDILIPEASAQVEGIAFTADGSGIFLGAENDNSGAAAIYLLHPDDLGYKSLNDLQIQYRPNPVQNRIFLSLNNRTEEIQSLSLSSLNGKTYPLLLQGDTNEKYADLPALPCGMYVLGYSINGKRFSARLIIP